MKPLNLSNFVAMTLTLDGRDKVTKIIAYLSRLLAFYYSSRSPNLSSRLASLKSALQMSRKPFRLFKSLNEVHKLRLLHSRPHHGPGSAPSPGSLPLYKKVCQAGKIVGLCGFWAADNVVFLTRGTPFLHPDSPDDRRRLAKRAYDFGARSYFVGALFHMVQGFVEVRGALEALRGHKRRERQRAAAAAAERRGRDDAGREGTEADTNLHGPPGPPGSDPNDDDDDNATAAGAGGRSSMDEESLSDLHLRLCSSLVSLFKAICDVLVFSNNVGLWRRLGGKPLNEAAVSVAGMGSAATVIFNKWPRV